MRRYPVGVEPAFCRAVELTLGVEGVFSDESWDPGGKTKYGITEAVARRHGHRVEDLTVPQAVGIYWVDYWRRPGFHEIESWFIGHELFDTAVNAGPGNAAFITQRAIVHNLFETETKVGGIDGRWGPKTRSAINRVARRYETNLMGALNGEQYVHYQSIRLINPELFRRAIRGWMRRVWPESPVLLELPWIVAAETGERPEEIR